VRHPSGAEDQVPALPRTRCHRPRRHAHPSQSPLPVSAMRNGRTGYRHLTASFRSIYARTGPTRPFSVAVGHPTSPARTIATDLVIGPN
jgi:hypothetical protein